MPNPTSISLLNYGFRADASKELLTVMLNCPEIDYSTAEEIRHCVKLAHFTQEEIDNAISELKAESLFTKYKSLTEAFMLPISFTSLT